MVLGLDPGVADGLVGGGTRRAVRAYQEGAGKAATGFVDSADVTAGGGSATGSPSAGRRPICWPAAT